jgi:hypothetical protein
MEATIDAIDNAGAVLVFGFLLAALYAVTLVLLLFAGLMLHIAWRWLTRNSVGTVVVHLERKALR